MLWFCFSYLCLGCHPFEVQVDVVLFFLPSKLFFVVRVAKVALMRIVEKIYLAENPYSILLLCLNTVLC